jgi:8-oxo-dGTP pyrophosphatase MutT (NUDIX family)
MKQAVAIVIREADRFLLIKRAKRGEAEDYWCPITGAIEPGETQEQAVIREASEEMGVTVAPIEKIWECYTEDKQYVLHWWSVRLVDDRITMNPDEVKDYQWVSYEQMKYIEKMFTADLNFFEEASKQQLE